MIYWQLLVTLDLNLTFMQPGSGSDPPAGIGWYFYEHEIQYYWSVWLAIPMGRWGYLSLYFVWLILPISTRERICLQNTSVLSLYTFKIRQCWTWTLFLTVSSKEFDLGTRGAFSRDWKSHKDVFAILPIGHGKSIIIQLIPDVGKYLHLSGYSYPHHVIILVVSSGLSYLQIAKPWHFQQPVWAMKNPQAFLENEKWRNMLCRNGLCERCGWKHSRKHSHWPWPSRSKDTTRHHLSGNISGW